jgi:hypothetical protein
MYWETLTKTYMKPKDQNAPQGVEIDMYCEKIKV